MCIGDFFPTSLIFFTRDYVTSMILFLATPSGSIEDARSVNLPNVTQLITGFHDNPVQYGSGQLYSIYTGLTDRLVPISQLYTYDVLGYLAMEDLQKIKDLLQDAWQTFNNGK